MSGSSRIGAVYEALRRFEADLTTHRITQDGCPVTRTHMMNARKVAKTLERYGLAKPQQNRKIDAAVTSVLAGASKPQQIIDNIGALKNTDFSDEELKAIDEISMQ